MAEGEVLDSRRMPGVGETLAGTYVLEALLAIGGMGQLYIARHVAGGDRVCLKVLSPSAAGHDGVIRFFREARAAAQLKSQHVVRILDVHHGDTNMLPFIVMELLNGRDLRYRIRHGTADIAEALQIGIQICDALGEAHAMGIVHRDIKPANIVLVAGPAGAGMVKVLDFGISKMASDAVNVTNTGTMMGSPAYMPPEQVRSGRSADARADIWSVGIVLYELLTGRSPFQRDEVASTLLAVMSDEIPPAHAVRLDIPRSLADAITKCIQKRPADRFQSMAELAATLRSIAAGDEPTIALPRHEPEQVSHPASNRAFRTDVAMATGSAEVLAPPTRQSGSKSFGFAIAGMLVGIVAVGGVYKYKELAGSAAASPALAPRTLAMSSRAIAGAPLRGFSESAAATPAVALHVRGSSRAAAVRADVLPDGNSRH